MQIFGNTWKWNTKSVDDSSKHVCTHYGWTKVFLKVKNLSPYLILILGSQFQRIFKFGGLGKPVLSAISLPASFDF